MKVTLIDYTGKGAPNQTWRAADLLIFTKSTRLKMSPGLLDEVAAWPEERKLKELAYMANTIPSSWEFCDYTFMIEGVTRAFTHQFVRTRTMSYAQQTMRVLDVSSGPGWEYGTGPTIAECDKTNEIYVAHMRRTAKTYKELIAAGAAIEDARGVLPTNILTNIVAKGNLRTMVELIRKRSSPRTQGEYRLVLNAMKSEILTAHPWAHLFIDQDFDKAAADLDAAIKANVHDPEQATAMIKLVDQMRRG